MMDFLDVRQRAGELKSIYGTRDNLLEEMRRMFHMEWAEAPGEDWIKPTMSPSAHNALMGAVRLMVSTAPQFNMPYDQAATDAQSVAEKIERACAVMWHGSGRIAQRPVHYEAVFSGLFAGEICMHVTRTADLLGYARASGNKGHAARMEHIARRTPYLFTTFNPLTCYGEFDPFGLRAMLRQSRVHWCEVLSTWGEKAAALGGARKPYDFVTLNDWYDWEQRTVWIDEDGDQAIWHAPHGLSFLPVIDQIVDGTALFDRPELQRIPFYYSLMKSGLWKRENLSLTMIYSLMFALGSNPLLQQEVDNLDEPGATIDRTVPGGIIRTAKGSPLKPLMEKVVDPEQYRGYEIARSLNEESTIPKMALGAPPATQLAFSAISLLVQSGRLPLIATKQLGAEAIASGLEAALTWYKADPKGAEFYDYDKGRSIELAPDEIPERLSLRVNLDPDLPQDKLQLANTAVRLTEGSNPLASNRWVRENILNAGQSQQMDREILEEKLLAFQVERILGKLTSQDRLQLEQQIAQLQQVQQAQRQAQSEQVSRGAGEMSAEMGAGRTPPEIGPYPPGGQVGPGQPLNGPLPMRGMGGGSMES